MGVNAYFPPTRTTRPHAKRSYGTGQQNVEIDYYRQKYCFPENWFIYEESWKNKVKK